MSAVCALGVAPLVGVRIGWLVAIMGVEEGWAEDWLSDAVTLSIVQRDVAAGRWRVHKLLAEYLRDVLRGASRVEEPASAQSAEVMKPHNAQAPGRWARVLAWLRALFGRGDESATASQHAFVVASAGLEADAIARMDAWVLERLLGDLDAQGAIGEPRVLQQSVEPVEDGASEHLGRGEVERHPQRQAAIAPHDGLVDRDPRDGQRQRRHQPLAAGHGQER